MANAKVRLDGFSAIEAAALGKISGKGDLTPGDHQVDCIFHVKGCLRKGEDYQSTPTRNVPVLAALMLAVKRMGFQRDKFLEIIKEAMKDAIDGKTAADVDEITTEAAKAVKEMLGELPKVTSKGATILVGDLVVEKIKVEIAAIRN